MKAALPWWVRRIHSAGLGEQSEASTLHCWVQGWSDFLFSGFCDTGGWYPFHKSQQDIVGVSSLLLHVSPRDKLRSSGLVASVFTHWAILPAQAFEISKAAIREGHCDKGVMWPRLSIYRKWMQCRSRFIRVTQNEATSWRNAWKGTQDPEKGIRDATAREISGHGGFGAGVVKSFEMYGVSSWGGLELRSLYNNSLLGVVMKGPVGGTTGRRECSSWSWDGKGDKRKTGWNWGPEYGKRAFHGQGNWASVVEY